MTTMLLAGALTLALALPQSMPAGVSLGTETFSLRVVTSGLNAPWDIELGPDGWLWVTERVGKQIVRVNVADGTRKVATTVPDVLQKVSQDGLLGLAFHEGFGRGRGTDYVYAALTYDADPGPGETRRMLIRRYRWDATTETLSQPSTVIDNLPAGVDHLSGRLLFGHDGKLYLTLGDGGLNQFAVYCQTIQAQALPTAADVAARDWPKVYQGKILRVNLDGSIPADNPLLNGVRSHIYSYGHRNAQGLAETPDGRLYNSEHGPSMDDEVNRIVAGRNYGWPHVAGYKDDRVYTYANWSAAAPEPCSSLKWDALVSPPAVPQQKESAWNAADFMPPLQTFFTVGADYKFDQGNATIAPSSIAAYTQATIPGWANSLLVTSLIRGVVYRVKLNAAGDQASDAPLAYFRMDDRFRDIVVSPDGRTIYVATDSNSKTHPGAILAFTYQN